MVDVWEQYKDAAVAAAENAAAKVDEDYQRLQNELKICRNCNFWYQNHFQPGFEECRRHAPVVDPTDKYAKPKSPRTPYDFGCGDFERSAVSVIRK